MGCISGNEDLLVSAGKNIGNSLTDLVHAEPFYRMQSVILRPPTWMESLTNARPLDSVRSHNVLRLFDDKILCGTLATFK